MPVRLDPWPGDVLEALPSRQGLDEVIPGSRVALYLPVLPVPLPRTTRYTVWKRQKAFIGFREAVRWEAFCSIRRRCKEQGLDVWVPGTPLVESPFSLWLAVAPGTVRTNVDLSNLLKALEDVLVGWGIPDDRSRFLVDTRASLVPGLERGGFAFVLERRLLP